MRLDKCTLMRRGTIASAALLVFGVSFITLAAHMLPDMAHLTITANVIGILALLAAPALLAVMLVLAVWPGSGKYLANCIH